jgi:hypothetical protein
MIQKLGSMHGREFFDKNFQDLVNIIGDEPTAKAFYRELGGISNIKFTINSNVGKFWSDFAKNPILLISAAIFVGIGYLMYSNTANQNNSPEKVEKILTEYVENEENQEDNTDDVIIR